MACSPANRDIEEMLLERGLEVDHSTLNRWVPAYAPLIERRLRAFRNCSKGFGFAGAWTVREQNRLLTFCFGLPQVNKI